MMILTVDEIIQSHSKLILNSGGSDGIRDYGLLESAVYSAQSSYGGTDFYPTVEEKAARLAYAIVNNHPFIDGNKRIGMLVMLMTLDLNDIKLYYTQREMIELGLSVADKAIGYQYEDILMWIRDHRNNRD